MTPKFPLNKEIDDEQIFISNYEQLSSFSFQQLIELRYYSLCVTKLGGNYGLIIAEQIRNFDNLIILHSKTKSRRT